MRIKLDKNKWHYWGRWRCVMLFSSPWFGLRKSKVCKKLRLPSLRGNIITLHGNYYFFKEDLDKLYNFVIKQIRRKTLWFKKFFALCDIMTKRMLDLEKKNDLKKFIDFLVEYLGFFILLEIIDFCCLEEYLNELCLKSNIPMVALTNKMQPRRKTLLMKYHSELEKLNPRNIDNFVNKYKWVGTHALEGSLLNRKKVFDELRALKLKKKSRKTGQQVKYNIPDELKRLIPIGRGLIFHRSNRIDAVNKVAFSYRPAMRELARKYGFSYTDLISFTHYELIDFIEKHKIPKDLKKRKKNFGLIYIDGKYSILLGKELKQALSQMQSKEIIQVKEFKGIVAFTGYIIGRVKIMRSFKDASRVKAGDIIVATETTPDYILAMRKAAAFVTNQGGITSHAAIVAREMKKPCIIGTKIATKVLKDGDLVEVDADKGVVKILKRK